MAKAKNPTSWVVWTRYVVQTFFLLLFFYLLLETVYHPFNEVGGWTTFFFDFDPLVLLNTWLATHAVPAVLLFSLITLGATILAGRWFCGWICPFGTFNSLLASLRTRRRKIRIDQSHYHPAQKIKYYMLAGLLVAGILGVNAIGYVDPFSFFYRSTATALYPAVNWGLQSWFTWVYNTDPGVGPLRATAVTEPVYEVLRTYFLAVEQPVYLGGTLIGLLFIGIVGLNFYRPRFWCRYLCPLGALLGVAGKNPLVRLTKDQEMCNNCQLCLVDCQGAAEPQSLHGWKPSECFYCWNCRDACGTQAITFQAGPPRREDPS